MRRSKRRDPTQVKEEEEDEKMDTEEKEDELEPAVYGNSISKCKSLSPSLYKFTHLPLDIPARPKGQNNVAAEGGVAVSPSPVATPPPRPPRSPLRLQREQNVPTPDPATTAPAAQPSLNGMLTRLNV